MVLHLLGKKSWNVYNRDNVDRVRRDEAAAAAKEEEAERRMQQEDASHRIAILRGEAPPPLSSASPPPEPCRRRDDDHGRDRKRRRLRGEDDTDRDMRVAREDAAAGEALRETLGRHANNRNDGQVSITDHAGHIQLFAAPNEKALLATSRNAEAEAEKAKKAREYEDQFTMRFSNAAGFKVSMSSAPWYASSSKSEVNLQQPSKDVWGNEDPRRKSREQMRTSSNDPMVFMQKAQTQLKQAETDKERWQAQKDKELRELERAEKEERRRRRVYRHRRDRRERSRSVDSLEDFALDPPGGRDKLKEDKKKRHDRDDRQRRSRSRDRRHGSSHHPPHRVHRR